MLRLCLEGRECKQQLMDTDKQTDRQIHTGSEAQRQADGKDKEIRHRKSDTLY